MRAVNRGTKLACDIYHSKSSNRIVQVRWHPWGENGTSILVMTSDSVLREFDTSHSSTQPLQAIPFHPSVPTPLSATTPTSTVASLTSRASKRKSTFTAEDVSSKTAVGFDLGQGQGEWGALAVWCCMKNGDVWTICPFLPEFASVPASYISTLNLYLGSKAQQYRLQNPQKPVSLSNSRNGNLNFSSTEHDAMGKKIAAQQRWARSLSRQVEAHIAYTSLPNVDETVDPVETRYSVRPPRDGHQVKRQGPYLVQPEPRGIPLSEEAGWGIEGVASDIIVLGDNPIPGSGTGLNVVGLAWVDGRVDMCLEVQKVEAEWETDEVWDWQKEALLTLVVYDSIDLGLLESLNDADEGEFTSLIPTPPTFAVDAMDPSDSVYVQHALGVHSINCVSWLDKLAQAMKGQDVESEETMLGDLWKEKVPSRVDWVIDTWSEQQE